MGTVESRLLAYIKRRLDEGALAATGGEILDAVVPPDHPEFRERPAYRFGLDRLLRRHVINAVDDRNGTTHYFIGDYASPALRESLGIGQQSEEKVSRRAVWWSYALAGAFFGVVTMAWRHAREGASIDDFFSLPILSMVFIKGLLFAIVFGVTMEIWGRRHLPEGKK